MAHTNQIIMSIRSYYASQNGGRDISTWMNSRISNPFVLLMHILTCVKVVLTLARVSRSSSLYRVCQGRHHSIVCVKVVLTLAHKLLILMHRLAICLLLYLCVRL